MGVKILVVDDEKDIADLLAYNLEKAGYRVLKAYDGELALRRILAEQPRAVVLDVMLPGMDGWEVLRRIRANESTKKIPVIMLTAKAEEADKVLGLELGADDYVTKPFSPKELAARLKALLRRGQMEEGALKERLEWQDLVIDPERFEVLLGKSKKEVVLTAKEFELLYYLASRPGRVIRRETLLDEIWNMDSDVETRTVDVHMRRLRQKLGAQAGRLGTIRGLGYKFTER